LTKEFRILDPTIIRRIQLSKLGDFGKCMGLLPKTKSVGEEELQQGQERGQP
jgi:hypothetical protein